MSVRVKGGMYCPACKKPVTAVRQGHAVRNTLGAAASFGLALKHENWVCPDCGNRAFRYGTAPTNLKQQQSDELAVVKAGAIMLPVAILVGVIASAAAAVVIFFVGTVLLGAYLGIRAM